MAIYSLLFGHVDWPDAEDTPNRRLRVHSDDLATTRLTLRVPEALKGRLEESAALAGVPPEAWIVTALSRSVDPRLGTP